MAQTIPLIRSAVLFPLLRWLRANDGAVQACLDAAGLAFVTDDAPERPIPLLSAMVLLRDMSRAEGPDIAAKAMNACSFADLGIFGQIFTGSPSPRVALHRAACALPRYSSHELVTMWPIAGGGRLEAGWSLIVDDETLAISHQFTAALVHKLLAAARAGSVGMLPVRIMPHPQLGLGHLRQWFGDDLATSGPVLTIDIDDGTLDAPLALRQALPAGEAAAAWSGWDVLIGDSSLSHSSRELIKAMVDGPPATLATLAQAAGLTERSFQRGLQDEGSSFRRLVDEVRRDRTLGMLPTSNGPLAQVANDVGYTAQSSLSRAVRRWTGASPATQRSTRQQI